MSNPDAIGNVLIDRHLEGIRLRETMSLIVERLRRLREDIEAEQGELTPEQTYLLTDACQALGMIESEIHHVVGETYSRRVSLPVSAVIQVPWEILSTPKIAQK